MLCYAIPCTPLLRAVRIGPAAWGAKPPERRMPLASGEDRGISRPGRNRIDASNPRAPCELRLQLRHALVSLFSNDFNSTASRGGSQLLVFSGQETRTAGEKAGGFGDALPVPLAFTESCTPRRPPRRPRTTRRGRLTGSDRTCTARNFQAGNSPGYTGTRWAVRVPSCTAGWEW